MTAVTPAQPPVQTPAQASAPTPSPVPAPAPAVPPLAAAAPRPKVLVVDDLAPNRLAMKALLESPDVEVLMAASGAEALELLLQHEVAVALVDVQMPEMDGPALAGLMRGTERTKLVPIIFVTAIDPDPQRRFEGYEAGAVDFVYKPVEPVVLKSKVAVFLALDRQRRELDARMRELDRMVALNRVVIGSLSHDIRTPLAALTLNAELVARRAENGGLQQAVLRIKAAIGMLSRQIDHLVNLASLGDAALEPRPEPADLPRLLHERIRTVLGTAVDDEQVPVTVEGDPQVSADPRLLVQALDQLLLVLGAHRGDAPIQVMVDGHARRLVLVRLHTPAVLPEAVQNHLFGGSAQQPGLAASRLGPGLQLVDRIARSHGGSLIGRSGEREGTLFELMLPRQAD